MKFYSGSKKLRLILLYFLLGILIGVFLLHPLTTLVYWYDSSLVPGPERGNFTNFLLQGISSAFSLDMLPMTLIFALIGGFIGSGFGLYHLALTGKKRFVQYLETELVRELPSLIKSNENERLEFKSSVRWDLKNDKINRGLEIVIAKSLAAFMNHQGGNLIIGVDDNGGIVGIENDYNTLKDKNRDGFERCIMTIVKTRLGGNLCSLVHCLFYKTENKDICRVIVEPSEKPVFCFDGNNSRYFLRTGNGTRELDAREAVEHISGR